MITFSQRLKEARQGLNLSQQQLAKEFNVTKMAISHWENGNAQPDFETLIRLAAFFDVSTDYLLGVTD